MAQNYTTNHDVNMWDVFEFCHKLQDTLVEKNCLFTQKEYIVPGLKSNQNPSKEGSH